MPLGPAGSSSWWRTTDASCQGLMALPLMVRLRESEQDDEASDAVEDVDVVRPLEEGECVVSTVSLRFRCVMMDIGV